VTRLAKYIAKTGLCSRREAEKLIFAGLVMVNGQLIQDPAVRVTGAEQVTVRNKVLHQPTEKARLWLYHKPRGKIVSRKDERGRETIFADLSMQGRLLYIGRLDYNSEGLLLLTNSGELAHQLALPASGWVRRYRVRVFGEIPKRMIDELAKGITVEEMKYAPIKAVLENGGANNHWLLMELTEGKNREIRYIMQHFGLQISRLIRVSFGPYELGNLEPGKYVEGKVPLKSS
jgi:23S rRNA pseudouridine2605 synthase